MTVKNRIVVRVGARHHIQLRGQRGLQDAFQLVQPHPGNVMGRLREGRDAQLPERGQDAHFPKWAGRPLPKGRLP